MALHVLKTTRTALGVTAVGAAFASPVLLSSEHGLASGRAGAKHAEPGEQIVVGGARFEMPAAWERMRSVDLPEAAASGMCPAGRDAGLCARGLSVTFVTYDGEGPASTLPELVSVEQGYDASLRGKLGQFRKVAAETNRSTTGQQYGTYEFTHRVGPVLRHKLLATYPGHGGAGVVAVVDGPARALTGHRDEVEAFLEGAEAAVQHG